ncbi:MAG: murein L,D-transpeptidase catalytic domain family protein [Legionellales bacterium]|nr:murein L,D-transpeptidase catalytic domain family protein [Legionellales bacterium]
MRNIVLSIIGVSIACFSHADPLPHATLNPIEDIVSEISSKYECPIALTQPVSEVEAMLHREASGLNVAVINKALTSLQCANKYQIVHNHILTIIDYSRPSSEKRLWIFDLKNMTLLFHTYVSHGIKTGVVLSDYFSNRNNSKASSLGVYTTDDAYFGRHGLSLKLDGLESGFNDNASHRAVVMHGGWYVEERFIKRYGRAGRSWGCPAVPDELIEPIIHTIKDKSLFVVYYPNEQWLSKSRFLRCDRIASPSTDKPSQSHVSMSEKDTRADVLFVDLNGNHRFQENKPLLTVTATSYEQLFKSKAPVDRMLRRQINDEEYIVLSPSEFEHIAKLPPDSKFDQFYFVIPALRTVRGYVRTDMNLVNFGKIKEISAQSDLSHMKPSTGVYSMQMESRPVFHIVPTSQFIRWVGL